MADICKTCSTGIVCHENNASKKVKLFTYRGNLKTGRKYVTR